MNNEVLIVIGIGGMGEAIARRQGTGRKVLLADFSEPALQRVGDSLRGEGYDVTTQMVDVSSRASVTQLADSAQELGAVAQVAHTAGLSPAQAPAKAVLEVDLVGVAYVLEEFGRVVAPGGAGVVIASMAGYLSPPLPLDQEGQLALTPADDLLSLPFVDPDTLAAGAYSLAKRANQLRVQAASYAWGARGARINSVSPGIISTPMGQQELAGDSGRHMRAMIETSGTKRLGTPADIADAVAFLLGPHSSFITGTDLLVDGGVVAAVRSGRLRLPTAHEA